MAGRTDTGVHARGQVAHADVQAAQWEAAGPVLRRLAGLLPPDVRARAIGLAPDGFDARFSALWRRYSYRVCDESAAADPLRRGDTLWHPRPLDVALMNEAAAALAGEHDFAAFCRRREGASTVRALLRLEWQRTAPGLAEAAVVADAFCHNMVRALTGALLAVGDGRQPRAGPPRCSPPGSATRPCTSPRRMRCAWKRSATRRPAGWPPAPPPPAASAAEGACWLAVLAGELRAAMRAAVLAGSLRAAMRAAFPPRSLALLRRAASLVGKTAPRPSASSAGSAGGLLVRCGPRCTALREPGGAVLRTCR